MGVAVNTGAALMVMVVFGNFRLGEGFGLLAGIALGHNEVVLIHRFSFYRESLVFCFVAGGRTALRRTSGCL